MRGYKLSARSLRFTGGGALAGLVYHVLVGCRGGCVIGASPWLSMLWLGAVGWLLAAATGREREADGCSI